MLNQSGPRFTTLAIALLLLVTSLTAQSTDAAVSPEPGRLTLETERVVVFKDGYTLFVKRATGRTERDGTAYMEEVPDAAVLGSFWSTAEGRFPILSTTAEWVETAETRTRETDCVTHLELLRVNKGRRVRLELSGDRLLEGKVLSVLELDPVVPEGAPPTIALTGGHLSSYGRPMTPLPVGSPLEVVHELVPERGDLVALATANQGRVVLPISDVRSISGDDLITRMDRAEHVTRRTKRLSYAFGHDAAGRDVVVHLMYFTPGMRWIPTYRLSGDLQTDAEVSLQGEILNEVEDIDGAALDLVVGVPNFRFKDVVSPLVLEQALRHALREAAPNLMNQSMSNTFTQRAGEWRGDTSHASDPDVMALAPELATAGSHDLFVYGMPSFTLRKGARSTVAVWRDRVGLRHLYTLDIGLVRNGSTGATASRRPGTPDLGSTSPLELARYQVWHQLELRNGGDVPWTTGPALLLRNGLPLGQDLLTYTPIGGTSLLPVTVAVDIRGDLKENEIERTPDALKVDGTSYTLIRKRGEITITNYKKEQVTTRVRLSLGGKVEEAGHDGTVSLNEFRPDDWEARSHAVNNHTDVEWTIDLAPSEQTSLDYVTSFYTR